jgi:phosphoglycolate phosphatase-like HAD superfamily hydrolase
MKIFALLLATVSLFGEIIEAPHFRQLRDHLTPDTLVLLDIDDTLLIPVQMLGCDEWFKYLCDKHQKEGLSPLNALEKSLAEWEAVRHLTKMELVEPKTNEIVQELQKEGYRIMGLTTQGLALATRTVLQLQEQQIDLLVAAPEKEDIYLTQQEHGVLYRHGILFTSGTKKGEALFQLLEKMGYAPKRIVFINDKASHLADVEAVAQKRGIPFIGLRYAYSDARKAAFRMDVAEYQFNTSTFTHILSDQEALHQLKKN